MRFLSVCSGIEAASLAWNPLGWKAIAFSEIEPFPCAVLAHHYLTVPNYGDMTRFKEWPDAAIDVLAGGTPCQAFSVAGLRQGLADPRGNLAIVFLGVVDRYRPRWVVWENVPGVISSTSHDAPDPCPPPDPVDLECDGQEVVVDDEYDSDEVHAFSCFLAGLSELGYGVAYRTLDAQYAGLAQRRERVFVVGYRGEVAGSAPTLQELQRFSNVSAAVLFERHCLQGDPAPRREARKDVTGTLAARTSSGGGLGTDFDLDGGLLAFGGGNAEPIDVGTTLTAHTSPRLDFESDTWIAHTLRAEGFDASEDGTGRGTPLIPVYSIQERAVSENLESGPGGKGYQPDLAYTLEARQQTQAIAFNWQASGETGAALGFDPEAEITGAIQAGQQPAILEPYTLAIRGRNGEPELEYRQDGTTNALLTPNGGRSGIGVGAIAFAENSRAELRFEGGDGQISGALSTGGGKVGQGCPSIMERTGVRRLTPRECERLQGMPDDWTRIPWRGKPAEECPDGPRYKAIGNSWAVPCARWIGERIEQVEALIKK